MIDFEELSDNEINELVAERLGGYAGNVHGHETAVKVKDPESGGLFYMEVDYCNNPSDAWPIILKNHIWIQPDMIGDGLWRCYDRESDFAAKHSNPLRAAVIVFLMMQDVQ